MATIQSVQTADDTTTTTLTITKPTSLAEGDMMLALVQTYTGGGTTTASDETGWTTIGTASVGSPAVTIKAYSKIATAGDVAASNFTFDVSATQDAMRGIIYRITAATTPIVRAFVTGTATASTTPSFTVNLVNISGSALIAGIAVEGNATGSTGYTINGTNPTWTERFESISTTSFVSASAITSDNTTITSFSYSQTNSEATGLILILVADQTNAAGTAALHSADADFFAPTAASGTTGTNALLEAGPTFAAPVGDGTVPTAWTLTQKS